MRECQIYQHLVHPLPQCYMILGHFKLVQPDLFKRTIPLQNLEVKTGVSKSHYEEFNWLEYSAAQNCAFCFPCRMFYNECIANSEDGFVKVGFRNWKKAIEKFSRHEKSSVHLANVEKLALHKISEETGSINTHLSNEYKQEVERNVAYLSKVFDIVMFLGKQGLALRGHDEKKSSSSKGNFLEMCEFLGKYDTSFAASYNKKISYCSKDVQNEIVDIITSIAIEKIVKQVKNCGFYAIMADEARCQKEPVIFLYTIC